MSRKQPQDNKRRKLLKFLGLSSLFGSVNAGAQIKIQNIITPQKDVNRTSPAGVNYIAVKLLRPQDLLSLELRYYNFSLSGKTLQKKADPAYLAVIFQPQSMLEECGTEDTGGMKAPNIPARMIIGGQSRIVFQVPESIKSIGLNLNELLAWENYDLVVNSRAKEPADKKFIYAPIFNSNKFSALTTITNTDKTNLNVAVKKGMTKDEKIYLTNLFTPAEESKGNRISLITANIANLVNNETGPVGEMETALEVPVRLYLSPLKNAGWKHAKSIAADNGILLPVNKLYELWHTRLAQKNGDKIIENDLTEDNRLLRALWADDAKPNHTDTVDFFPGDAQFTLTSMIAKDRHQIVHESSNFSIAKFTPPPIKAKKLFLSTLGAWLDSTFVVERKTLENAGVISDKPVQDGPVGASGGNALNLLKWRHIETMGREHYVEVVRAGNIMPFGHEAVLIKITERKPYANNGTATNFQRQIVVITEPVKDYNYKDTTKNEFMNFSFSSVEIITTATPMLDTDKQPFITPGGPSAELQFVITVGKKPLAFKIKGTDLDGNIVDFSMPLIFIDSSLTGTSPALNSLINQYNNAGLNSNYNWSDFGGKRFSLAPTLPTANAADTVFSAYRTTFGVKAYSRADELQGFLPTIKTVDIIEPSSKQLTGMGTPVSVSLVDVTDEAKNKGQVFAQFNFSQPVNFAANTDKTGGIAAPNFNLSGLSRTAGVFAGKVENMMNKAVDAMDYFNVSSLPDPKLFGVFKLSDILQFANSDDAYDLTKKVSDRAGIPNLTTENKPDAFITSYVLKPGIKPVYAIGDFVALEASKAAFAIVTQVKAWKDAGKAPEFSTNASLKNFSVSIVKAGGEYLFNINFDEIKFAVSAVAKAEVAVKMKKDKITFGGPLRFLNDVNKLLDAAGFDDPPFMDVSLTGIRCGYTQALPDLQLGAFSLSHLSVAAEINLPFTGGPLTAGFRFCERQQPFTLAVAFLGGGGFFGFEVDLHGLRQLEASLEFGACASINFGVASGAVSIMAGIYFKMTFENGQNSTQLTGYVRINGAVSVLGLITASIELYMALTYLMDKHKAYGEASIKVKVEVLFFSKTVTIHTQKTFAGSGSDPNFQTALTPLDWHEYCDAFAA